MLSRERAPRRTRLVLVSIAVLGLAADVCLAKPRPIGPGVTYERMVRPEGPWVIDVVRIDRSADRVEIRATLGCGQVCGTETLPKQLPAGTATERPIAAVNADFFVMTGTDTGLPMGVHLVGARLVHAPPLATALVFGGGGRVAIRDLAFRVSLRRADGVTVPLAGVNHPPKGADIALYTPDYGPHSRGTGEAVVVLRADGLPVRPSGSLNCRVVEVVSGPQPIPPDGVVLEASGGGAALLRGLRTQEDVVISVETVGLPAWADSAVSGGAVLLRDGKPTERDDIRHPRTIVGWDDRELVLVTIDGRQPGWSVGMNYRELAQLLIHLGCTDGINLDGGGSTTMWVRGEVRNRPSDGSPRKVANGLAVVLHGVIGPAARIVASPAEIWGLPGAEAALSLSVEDADCNPVRVPMSMWTTGVARGPAVPTVRLASPGEGAVQAVARRVPCSVPVHCVARPTAARLVPPLALAVPGDRLRFAVELLGPARQVLAAPAEVSGSVVADAALGTASLTGLAAELAVRDGALSGRLGIRVLGASATARVVVARPVTVTDCEADGAAKFGAAPEQGGPTGGIRLSHERPYSGAGCIALDYALGASVATRAAYAVFGARVGRALGFRVALRAEGSAPWVRLAYRDGNGTRETATLADRLEPGSDWRKYTVRLPDDTRPPVTLESVYVVETDAALRPAGTLLIDDVTAWVLPEPEAHAGEARPAA